MQPLLTPVPVVWGSADRIETRPDLVVHEHAVYRPADGTPAGHSLTPASEFGGAVATAPDGFYLLVDVMTGHYGHFIADVLSRLWPILDGPTPPIRLVCGSGHGRAVWERYPFIAEILAGLDLSLDAVISFETPVVLPRAAVAAPSFCSLQHFHDVFGALCRRAGRGYWREDEVDTVARPAYLSKMRLTTGMHCLVNEREVAAELDRLGADILFPETMSFPEQVREFARRRVLMGPVGSAFHTAAFSAPGRRTIGLSGMLHLNSNNVMFDAINGARAYYYYVPGMTHGTREGFGLAWTVPRPKDVAAWMLERAEDFDRIPDIDAWAASEAASRGQGLVGRLRDRIAGRWQRFRSGPESGPP